MVGEYNGTNGDGAKPVRPCGTKAFGACAVGAGDGAVPPTSGLLRAFRGRGGEYAKHPNTLPFDTGVEPAALAAGVPPRDGWESVHVASGWGTTGDTCAVALRDLRRPTGTALTAVEGPLAPAFSALSLNCAKSTRVLGVAKPFNLFTAVQDTRPAGVLPSPLPSTVVVKEAARFNMGGPVRRKLLHRGISGDSRAVWLSGVFAAPYANDARRSTATGDGTTGVRVCGVASDESTGVRIARGTARALADTGVALLPPGPVGKYRLCSAAGVSGVSGDGHFPPGAAVAAAAAAAAAATVDARGATGVTVAGVR